MITRNEITDSCKYVFKETEDIITQTFNKNISNFKKAAKISFQLICKNLVLNFLVTIMLLAISIGGLLYAQNYRDGTKIAEAKAVEALAEEKNDIEKEAISSYKKTAEYRKDACKMVAENITSLEVLNYLYIYVKSESLKKYPQLKLFYNEFLKPGYKQYREKYGTIK